MEDQRMLICFPVDWDPEARISATGSTREVCLDCGAEVWITPAGRDLLRERKDTIIICIPCGGKRLGKDPIKVQRMTEKQRLEVEAFLSRS